MRRPRVHLWHVRLIVSGITRAAEYRVIAETARGALNKAMRHVAATESHCVAAVTRTRKHVNASRFARDCELIDPPSELHGDREDTREPFRADLNRTSEP